MIHIKLTKFGYTVETRSSHPGRDNLSSTSKQLFSRKSECWTNIRAQMQEWQTALYVWVQDNTLKGKPKVYRVFRKGKDLDKTRKPE